MIKIKQKDDIKKCLKENDSEQELKFFLVLFCLKLKLLYFFFVVIKYLFNFFVLQMKKYTQKKKTDKNPTDKKKARSF